MVFWLVNVFFCSRLAVGLSGWHSSLLVGCWPGQVQTAYRCGGPRRAEVQVPYKPKSRLTVEAGSTSFGGTRWRVIRVARLDFFFWPGQRFVSHQRNPTKAARSSPRSTAELHQWTSKGLLHERNKFDAAFCTDLARLGRSRWMTCDANRRAQMDGQWKHSRLGMTSCSAGLHGGM